LIDFINAKIEIIVLVKHKYRNTFAAVNFKTKKMRLRIILRYVGVSLLLVSALMLVSAIIAMFNGRDESMFPLLYSTMITFVVGIYPLIFVRPESHISTREGYAIVVGSWLSACIFGMLPYLCYGDEFTFTNSLFESVSGFTTTGASILNDIESLPLGLKFWRVSTAWVGGIGIVTIFSLLIPKSHDGRSILSGVEISDIARGQAPLRGKPFIIGMLSVYVSMTLLCGGALKLAGLSWFDAITNAMSTCSTCGFCVMNNSIAAYDSLAVELIIIAFMITSGISFIAMHSLFRGNPIFKSEILKAYLLFLLFGTALISINLNYNRIEPTYWESLRAAAFQMCSLTTTTGFATANTTTWPSMSIVILIVASIVCGCSGSTSGGMKMDRIVMLCKQLRINIIGLMDPRTVNITRVDGKVIKESRISDTMSFVLLYLGLIMLGSIINAMGGLDLATSFSASVACIGNVGPGFGSVGSFGNYADFPVVLKFSSMLLMLAGRLEITPFLFVIGQACFPHK